MANTQLFNRLPASSIAAIVKFAPEEGMMNELPMMPMGDEGEGEVASPMHGDEAHTPDIREYHAFEREQMKKKGGKRPKHDDDEEEME